MPARRKLKMGEGYAPWTWEQIAHFREHAKPELWWAAALALYSGQRQGDCLSMIWSDVEGGRISVVQDKTEKSCAFLCIVICGGFSMHIPRRSMTILSNTLKAVDA